MTVFQLKEYGMLKRGLHASTVITWVQKHTGKESSVGVEVNMIGRPYARITYAIVDGEGNTTPYDSQIDLITSPCHFGGTRYWFVCPWCDSRVGGVYLAPGERHFKCRTCNDLTYRSRNRCKLEAWGHTSRQIDKLQGEIKRWSWRGLPTRQVRRLYKLRRKMDVLDTHVAAAFDKLKGRVGL